MSEEGTSLTIRMPAALHEKAKTDAKSIGLTLKDYVISKIEEGPSGVVPQKENVLITLLSQARTTERFGDETVLEEMMRRMVSMHLLMTAQFKERVGAEKASEVIAELDDLTEAIVKER